MFSIRKLGAIGRTYRHLNRYQRMSEADRGAAAASASGAEAKSLGPSVTVLYGSETGTAEDLAYRLGHQLREAATTATNATTTSDAAETATVNRVAVSALDDLDLQRLAGSRLAVFVVATAGDGEVPANMRLFWRRLLARRLGPSALLGLQVAVFGLGDSSYDKYNAAAR